MANHALSGVTGFVVYRNGSQMAVLNATTFEYNDHNREKNVKTLYSVASLYAAEESSVLDIVLPAVTAAAYSSEFC